MMRTYDSFTWPTKAKERWRHDILPLFEKARDLFSRALSIGVFGLNGFILLLWKNQHNASFVYVIWCITVAYIITLAGIYITHRHQLQTIKSVVAKPRLIFRWLYVAVYLTIILMNMKQMGSGRIDFSNGKLVFQWIMFLYIALTIPRYILLRKALACVMQKWTERKASRHCECETLDETNHLSLR